MEAKLLESIGADVGSRWTTSLFSSAAVFWIGGCLAWLWSRGWGDGVRDVEEWLSGQNSAVILAAAAGSALLVAATGWLADHLTFPLLRLMEGYWPRWCGWMLRPFVALQRRRRDRLNRRYQELAGAVWEGTADTATTERYRDVEAALARLPTNRELVLASRFGNVMRAAETRPYDKYRLDIVQAWPRLWMVMPAQARDDLVAARSSLDGAALGSAFVALSAVWALLEVWMLPLALLGSYALYRFAVVPSASAYGDLVESAADIFRSDLYSALGLPAATSPVHDRAIGEFVNEYLLRGSTRPEKIFIDPAE